MSVKAIENKLNSANDKRRNYREELSDRIHRLAELESKHTRTKFRVTREVCESKVPGRRADMFSNDLHRRSEIDYRLSEDIAYVGVETEIRNTKLTIRGVEAEIEFSSAAVEVTDMPNDAEKWAAISAV